jgi:L-2-hydroxyglutarate oxidase LhgO
MFDTDVIVIGAGVIGLAVARTLALHGREVIVVERETLIGSGTSSRNSEVIHAGIYYEPGSLKAKLTVEGRDLLYAYAVERGFAAKRIGKLIVAADDGQVDALGELAAVARRNGLRDLVRLSGDEARAMEPQLRCIAALHSPSTGIVDSHAYMLALQGELEDAGGAIAFGCSVTAVEVDCTGAVVVTEGRETASLRCRLLINAAGLAAPDLAARAKTPVDLHVPEPRYCKGNYFTLSGVAPPFRRLVYPIPSNAGLGIHATVDLGGQVRFGPDTVWVDTPDYVPDDNRAAVFADAIRSYWPALPEGALHASYAGVRPKIVGPGEKPADFRIDGPELHGLPSLINLFGIESPGLTASLAIARHVARLAGHHA